jgi:hypothetical protein
MYEFTEPDLSMLLVNRLGYSRADAHGMIAELIAMQPAIKAAFLRWWMGGVITDTPEIEGHTARSLMQEHNLNPVAAFLTLDWLATEPEIAKQAIRDGYDEIRPG